MSTPVRKGQNKCILKCWSSFKLNCSFVHINTDCTYNTYKKRPLLHIGLLQSFNVREPEWCHGLTEICCETALALFHQVGEDTIGPYPNPSPDPHPNPERPAMHLWCLWYCGSPWTTVITCHQTIRLIVCPLCHKKLFYKITSTNKM